ncbi:MAG: hypothetical protein AB8F95_19270 [Bacteroidia bacterium]
MKNILFFLLLVAALFQACTADIPTCENCTFTCVKSTYSGILTNVCLNNWECEFNVIPQSEVDLEETEGLGSGEKIVFQMVNSTIGDPQIIDDEYTDVLVFELKSDQNSFSVEDDELKSMNVHFRKICYCVENQFKPVIVGCIQGEKQSDGSWRIQSNLTIPYSHGNQSVLVDALFSN